MLVRIALATLLAAAPIGLAGQEQEGAKPKVPKDSILVTVNGCIKGRVIRTDDVRQADTTSGFNVRASTFRIAGKKEVMGVVKEQDGQRAEIVGLIKKSSLIEPGIKFKGGRVVIGGGTSAGTTGSLPSPAENVLVLDALSIQGLGASCDSL